MSSDREPILRRLTLADIPAALQLSTEAGWNQTEDDWQLLLELAPDGCLGIEVAGELAATATLFCYGHQLAWIGMVLTRASFQGRGFAKRLMNEALALADRFGVESIKLDATDQGRPLYEKLGFRAEQPVQRWGCERSRDRQLSKVADGLDSALMSRDEHAFGANRSSLLQRLAQNGRVIQNERGHSYARPGRVAHYVGPCVADSPDIARLLIESSLKSSSAQAWYWDLLSANNDALLLAEALGFAPKRHLMRMVRGKDLRGDERKIYAIAGFELG